MINQLTKYHIISTFQITQNVACQFYSSYTFLGIFKIEITFVNVDILKLSYII